jgi:FAD/FMN-containing dehydrogenase
VIVPIPFFRVQQRSPGRSFDEQELTARLAGIVGVDHVLTESDDLTPYTVDWTGRYIGSGRIVVRPDSTAQVVDIVGVCREMSVPIVPQGGNTGLVGGSVPLQGEVVVSTRRMSTIGDVDRVARQVTVGAGVSLGTVQQSALEAGLRYPVDFGARDSATIGGTIATNAGGISVLRYGMTRRHIVGIEAVLGTGEVISHLGGLVKDNTGYDLVGLLCGSEGTLGIVTGARLQLVPLHRERTTALVGFDCVEHAMDAVGRVCAMSDDIDALEIFLESGVRLVAESFGRSVPFVAPVYVLVEASADEDRSSQL